MYSGGSVVGNASASGIEISLTPPLIFTGDQKVRNLASLNFKPHAFESAARYQTFETKVQFCDDLAKFGEVVSTHP